MSDNPKHQATLKRLRGVMKNWLKETSGQGEMPELKKDNSDDNAKAAKRAKKAKKSSK